MNVSVILCTYNRCRSLERALDSIAASKLPESVEWEVLVVDNNSSDQTREVIENFCRQYPRRFRYLFEPQQGQSNARNTGIREARGDILAFVDDDLTVEPTWLQNLTTALQNHEWGGAGGRILPEQNFSPPPWLSLDGPYALAAPLAIFNLGLKASELKVSPYGANMAFRKEMFEKYGGFRTDLGLRPGSEIRNEDTEFGSRLLAAHERLWYEPSAVVYHHIPNKRAQKEYFLAWWFDKGRADIRETGTWPHTKWCYRGIPHYVFRRLVVWTIRWMLSVRRDKRFYNKVTVWTKLGEIAEFRRLRNEAKKKRDCNAEV